MSAKAVIEEVMCILMKCFKLNSHHKLQPIATDIFFLDNLVLFWVSQAQLGVLNFVWNFRRFFAEPFFILEEIPFFIQTEIPWIKGRQ